MHQIWKESALEMKKAYVSLTANSLKLNILLVTTLGADPTQVDFGHWGPIQSGSNWVQSSLLSRGHQGLSMSTIKYVHVCLEPKFEPLLSSNWPDSTRFQNLRAKPDPVEPENRVHIWDQPKKIGSSLAEHVMKDLTESNCARTVPVGFLDTSVSGGRNSGSIWCQLFPGVLASGRFANGLLGRGHVALSANQEWMMIEAVIHPDGKLALLLWILHLLRI